MKSVVALLPLLISLVAAFAPTPVPQRAVTFKQGRTIAGFKPSYAKKTILRMAEEEKAAEAAAEDSTEVAPAAPKAGTFYDDEYDSAPQKSGISDSMKARLMAEASTGLDSEKKQTNVILYIILGVAALVVVGGQGIFF
ncbi:expressed unknown protein [Seminavis robusta]|uniref:Uncharacterized protein n=1 Tax=Seminavis robusta TaxID=568900 RepID=A0A9N8DKG5_9STRA|nr:expressed unknown protein [Seminavis robusta]|eukprot:Sro130_g061810.1 n/a (139) ;mRNA; f:23931-24432